MTKKQLERLTERIVLRTQRFNTEYVKRIAKRLNQLLEFTNADYNELVKIVDLSGDIDKIVKSIADLTDKNTKDIYAMMEETAKNNLEYSKRYLEYRGKEYIPYAENKLIQQEVKAFSKLMIKDYLNVADTSMLGLVDAKGNILNLKDFYIETINDSILKISQGRVSYQKEIRDTIKRIAGQGIQSVYYKNKKPYKRRLDSSVRMNILDGLNRVHNEMQKEFSDEFKADGVEISHHKNPAPDHEKIDGTQMSLKTYESLNLARPIGQLNCYHELYYVILDISKPTYTKEELEKDKQENKKGFTYNGKHYTLYEGEQLMRRTETEIRKTRDILECLPDDIKTKEKRNALIKRYYEISKVSGLPTRLDRVR